MTSGGGLPGRGGQDCRGDASGGGGGRESGRGGTEGGGGAEGGGAGVRVLGGTDPGSAVVTACRGGDDTRGCQVGQSRGLLSLQGSETGVRVAEVSKILFYFVFIFSYSLLCAANRVGRAWGAKVPKSSV